MVQIKCLSNGLYSLKNSHIPFGMGFHPPPLRQNSVWTALLLHGVFPDTVNKKLDFAMIVPSPYFPVWSCIPLLRPPSPHTPLSSPIRLPQLSGVQHHHHTLSGKWIIWTRGIGSVMMDKFQGSHLTGTTVLRNKDLAQGSWTMNKEQPMIFVTFQTYDQSNGETWHDQQNKRLSLSKGKPHGKTTRTRVPAAEGHEDPSITNITKFTKAEDLWYLELTSSAIPDI